MKAELVQMHPSCLAELACLHLFPSTSEHALEANLVKLKEISEPGFVQRNEDLRAVECEASSEGVVEMVVFEDQM